MDNEHNPPGSDSNNQASPTSAETFAQHAAPYKSKAKRGRRVFIIVLIVIIVLLIAGAAYLLLDRRKNGPPAKSANQPVPTSSSSNAVSQYVSNGNDLNLSFGYPADWTVTPKSNDNPNDQPITLNSPLTSIMSSSGSTVTGKVTVRIRPVGVTLSELSSGSVTAVQNSTQFAYSQPAADQFKYPYLTFLNLSGAADKDAAFQEALITGNISLTKGEPVAAADLTGLDPIISASFYQCKTQACTGSGATPLGITNDTWQNATIFKQVQKLFASLRLN